MTEIGLFNLSELLKLQKKGELTPSQIWEYYFKRRQKWEPKLNAFIKEGKFSGNGIPIGVKDNITVEGYPTTCGSRILKDYIAPYSATAWERLEKKGFALGGKTNLDEFAMGSSTEYSAFGPTRNPWDLSRVPGGSSGGSAAAVAAGMVKVALGSDTGGSVRQPSAFCGVVGFKPTYGRISRYGLVAFASSLDQIGIISTNVKDAAFVFSIIAGDDPRDSTTSSLSVPLYEEIFSEDLTSFTFLYPDDSFCYGVSEEILSSYHSFIKLLKKLGGKGKKVDLSFLENSIEAYYIVATAEASSNLARYDGVKYGLREKAEELFEMYFKTRTAGFGDEVKRRILLGTFVLSSGYYDDYYGKGVAYRAFISEKLRELFKEGEFIVLPTTPDVAFEIGKKQDPISMYLEDRFTVFVNIAGLPAISIPFTLSKGGLPIGVQIVSKWYNENRMLVLSDRLEGEILFENKLLKGGEK